MVVVTAARRLRKVVLPADTMWQDTLSIHPQYNTHTHNNARTSKSSIPPTPKSTIQYTPQRALAIYSTGDVVGHRKVEWGYSGYRALRVFSPIFFPRFLSNYNRCLDAGDSHRWTTTPLRRRWPALHRQHAKGRSVARARTAADGNGCCQVSRPAAPRWTPPPARAAVACPGA